MADERSRGPSGGLYRSKYAYGSSERNGNMVEIHRHYADDVLVSQVDDHIADLSKVFQQLEKIGINIKASKHKLGLKIMPFIGIVITRNGMMPYNEKTAATDNLEYPTNLKKLRSVQGMFASSRRFIAKFSETAALLCEPTKKSIRNPRNAKGFVQSKESKASFNFLKKAITKKSIMLHYPDGDVPFEIHTNASSKAVAVILCKISEGKERVLMSAFKTILENEQKYHIYEKEALAVVWAAEVVRKYIRNDKNIVKTDCAALQWLKSKNENTVVVRSVYKLSEIDLQIQNWKGRKNANVDGITPTPPPANDKYVSTQNCFVVANRGGAVGVSLHTKMHQGSHLANFSQCRRGRTPGRAQNLRPNPNVLFVAGLQKASFQKGFSVFGMQEAQNTANNASRHHRSTVATYANEVVDMDFLGPFPRSINGNRYIFTMIDIFTRWPVGSAVPDRLSLTIAKSIVEFRLCENVMPLNIDLDRALEFLYRGIKQLASYMGSIATHRRI